MKTPGSTRPPRAFSRSSPPFQKSRGGGGSSQIVMTRPRGGTPTGTLTQRTENSEVDGGVWRRTLSCAAPRLNSGGGYYDNRSACAMRNLTISHIGFPGFRFPAALASRAQRADLKTRSPRSAGFKGSTVQFNRSPLVNCIQLEPGALVSESSMQFYYYC